MERIPNALDLTASELHTLRNIVARSFVSSGTIAQLQRERLSILGLVHCAMGGVMPTPAGKIVARL